MAVEVGRTISALTKQTNKLTQEVKKSRAEVSALDKELKLNPGTVDLVRQKYSAFAKQLTLNQQKIATLNTKRKELDTGFSSGAISQKEYEKEIVKIKKEVEKTTKSIEECTVALGRQNAEIRAAKMTNLISGLDKVQQKAEKVSKATMVAVAAFGALLKKGLDVGGELDDLANKYSTTAEAIQLQEHRYLKITGSSEGYTASLQKVGAMQSSIASGRGARYLNFLKQLGLKQSDLENKNNGEIYNLISERLAGLTDQTQRATIAQGLFGTVGLDVAMVTGQTAEKLKELDDVVYANGIITNEQAQAAGNAGDRFDDLKGKLESVAVEALVDFMPTIEALTSFLKDTVLPLITSITNAIADSGPVGQKMLALLIVGIVVLPKVIGFAKTLLTTMQLARGATYAQAAATTTLTAASGPWLGVIVAISAALMLVVTLISMFIGKSKEAINVSDDLMNSLGDTQSTLEGMGYKIESASETTVINNQKKQLDVNVDVNAHGDTKSSQEYAQDVGTTISDKITADVINYALGSKVR